MADIVERLRRMDNAEEWLDPAIIPEAADLITRLRAEASDAALYAETLARAMHQKYHAGNTEWQPLSGDLIGLLTQIDNMTAGLMPRAEAFERAAQIAEIHPWGCKPIADAIRGSQHEQMAAILAKQAKRNVLRPGIRKASGEDKT